MHDSLSLYVKSTKNIGILTKKLCFWAFRGSKFGQIACFWAQSLCLGPIHMVWGFKIESEKNRKKMGPSWPPQLSSLDEFSHAYHWIDVYSIFSRSCFIPLKPQCWVLSTARSPAHSLPFLARVYFLDWFAYLCTYLALSATPISCRYTNWRWFHLLLNFINYYFCRSGVVFEFRDPCADSRSLFIGCRSAVGW